MNAPLTSGHPSQTAVPRDIGFFEWFFDPDTWTGDTGILASMADTVVLCAVVTLVAAAVSVPTAAILAHLRRAEVSSTWLVSISRAVPTFAIAALLVPWSLENGWGFEPWPIFIALLLLALVPIYLNTYTAIRQLPDGPVDAARALGYSERSILAKVELALASSLIFAGVRVAAIQVVATEPIRAFLGGDGLGRYVRDGFGQNNNTLVIGGIVLIGGLAALTGLTIRGAGKTRAAERRSPTRSTTRRNITMTTPNTRRRFVRLLAPLAVLGLVTAACGSDDDDVEQRHRTGGDRRCIAAQRRPDATTAPDDTTAMPDGPTIQIRGQDFSEAITIAEVYGQYLEAKGYPVEILTPAGFRTEALEGLQNGDFNLIVDYIGGTQAAVAPDAAATADPDEIVANIIEPLEATGATLLDYSPAVDGDAFVVRGDSEASTISDVAGLDYVLGGSSQCPERPQCLIGLEDPDIYGITFADFVTLEFGPLLGEALANSEVDAVIWNTTAPQITEQGFKVLEDDQGIFPAQNIAPIITTEVLDRLWRPAGCRPRRAQRADHHR